MGRDRAPEQRLHVAQLLVQMLPERAAQFEALRRERGYPGRWQGGADAKERRIARRMIRII